MDSVKFYIGDEDKVVIEDKGFENSLFTNQYVKALRRLEDILQHPSNTEPNIIAFCGDRGEGKSSCMESFATILENIKDENVTSGLKNLQISDAEKDNKLEDLCQTIKDSHFQQCNTIDPLFFDNEHNLIELLLGQMFSKLSKKIKNDKNVENDKDDDYRALLERFHDTKWNLFQLFKGRETVVDPIAQLDSLAAGVTLRESITGLITEYLRYFGHEGDYFVVKIDDLDLNIAGAYKMAEQIRKYLVSDKCIILISVNIDQLVQVINNSISKDFIKGEGANAEEMARKYVDKLIPVENRINMPRIRNLSDIKLSICSREKDKEGKEIELSHYNSVKEAVLKLIYQKTSLLLYNTRGSVSPIVPNNLRSLRHLIQLLLSMPSYRDGNNSSDNLQNFISYFYRTWIGRLQSDDKKFAMSLINEANTISINKKVVMYIGSRYLNIDNSNNDGGNKDLIKSIIDSSNSSYNVSLGDVYYLIDIIERERTDDGAQDLIFFLKVFYSILLHQSVDNSISELQNNEPDKNIEIYKEDNNFNNCNPIQKLINGSYFTYQREYILPPSKNNRYRDLVLYSTLEDSYKKVLGFVIKNIANYDKLTDEECSQFNRDFNILEFLALTTQRSISEKNKNSYNIAPRSSIQPYYLSKFNRQMGYYVFDVLMPFVSIINMKQAYMRYDNLLPGKWSLYSFAMDQDWSLLKQILKLYQNSNEILLESSVIKDIEVLDEIKDIIRENRVYHNPTGNDVDVILGLYNRLGDSTFRTYNTNTNNKKEPERITLGYFEVIAHFLSDKDVKDDLTEILSSSQAVATIDGIIAHYSKLFSKIYKTKHGKTLTSDFKKLYKEEAARLTDDDWKNIFDQNKTYSREQVAEILLKNQNKLTGAEQQIKN